MREPDKIAGKGTSGEKADRSGMSVPESEQRETTDKTIPSSSGNQPFAGSGVTGSAESAGTQFRKRKRKTLTDRLNHAIRRMSLIDLLPVAIILSGSAFAYFFSASNTDAGIITLTTASLAGLSILAKSLTDRSRKEAAERMQSRFEQLEDRAWELSESEERYRILAETFGDILIVRDAAGTITYSNTAYAALLDSMEKKQGNPGRLPPELESNSANPRPDNTSERKPVSGEIEVVTNNGVRWLQWQDMPVRENGKGGMGTLSVARDITVFKRTQQLEAEARRRAEEANRAKSRFLAMASHEMRTPLNGIIGISRLLTNTELDPEQHNYARAVEESGENLLELINGMLDLTMIEAGRFELRSETIEFPEFMNQVIELCAQKAYDKGIDCGLFIDPELPSHVVVDGGRLRQILINLVGNAIKFTEEGGVGVWCRRAVSDNGMATMVLEVTDTGPGLSLLDRERIFEEFERVDDEPVRRVDGAGLGLAISRAIAQQLDASIDLTETGPDGSTFTVRLPLTTQLPEAGRDHKADQSLLGANVLIVSTGQTEPIHLQETIRALGGRAVIAPSLKQCRTMISRASEPYSALLIDQDAITGKETELNAVKSGMAADARLVLMTLPEAKSRMRDFKGILDGWLVRPVRNETLIGVLKGRFLPQPSIRPKSAPPCKAGNARPLARVLLAEDNDINALLASSALKKVGIEVERVPDGEAAVSAFLSRFEGADENRFDVVLMDMHMPVMDGLEAIETIRNAERKSGALPTPIYALTADMQGETRKQANAFGADGFLVKPVCPDELCDLVLSHGRCNSLQKADTG